MFHSNLDYLLDKLGGRTMYIIIINHLLMKIFCIEPSDSSFRAQWIRYYLEVILVNIFKTLLVITVSILIKSFFATLITMSTFTLLRKYSYGWHSLNSMYCSIQSLILLVFIPKIFVKLNFPINKTLILALLPLVIFLFYRYAPQNYDGIEPFKIKMICILILFLLFFILCLLDTDWIKGCILIGILGELLMIAPITKKIIQGVIWK
jgi:accessory gene regulator B